MNRVASILTGLSLSLVVSVSAGAMPAVQPPADQSSLAITVADGCGPNGWRGPGGACHYRHWGYYGPGWRYNSGWGGNGCAPGYWRGPWGHCRNTPYHGRLPGGGWK